MIGTKPGDPLADLLFALVFLAFQISLCVELRVLGVLFTVPMRGCGIFGDASIKRMVEVLIPTYLDDFVVLARAADCMALLDQIEMIASTAAVVAASFGLRLNFSAGKTECLAVIAGPKAKAARQRLIVAEGADGAGDTPALPLSGGGYIRMIKAYKHLGAIAAATCPLGQEVAARTSSAGVACSALCRPVLGKTALPAKTRAFTPDATTSPAPGRSCQRLSSGATTPP